MSRTSRSARELLDRPAPSPDFTLLIEARDFLRVHLPRLTAKQRSTVVAWSGGKTCREIALEELVTEEAIHDRLRSGLRRLRQIDLKQ